MDVLQLIKKQHELIRALGKGLVSADTITDKRKVFNRLSGLLAIEMKIEAEYVLPEVTAVDGSARRVAEACLSRHQHLSSDLKALEKMVTKRPQPAKAELEKKLEMFCADLKTHLSAIEDELLPRIRQRIPTQEREDLGEALSDVLAEELEGLGIAEEIRSTPAAAM